MKRSHKNIQVGILGCGAIGSGIARSIFEELAGLCELSGMYDVDKKKAHDLEQSLAGSNLVKQSLDDLLKSCDILVEAVNANNTRSLIRKALEAKKDVLAMSVGKLLNAPELFELAASNHSSLIVPSGAIAGVDAIKAASLKQIHKIRLTTRKPPAGLAGIPYIEKQGIALTKIKDEQLIFEGDVDSAVKNFPRNINVAATLALACQNKSKITIRIITSPKFKVNSHEIEISGEFGKIHTRSESIPCPDNPRTSYLAVLSGIQSLKEYCTQVRIGT